MKMRLLFFQKMANNNRNLFVFYYGLSTERYNILAGLESYSKICVANN